MSGVLNCRRCGKIFQAVMDKKICPDCVKQEEVDFETVKEFIMEHPSASMQMVSNDTGVSSKLILKFVREGRIEFLDGKTAVFVCESCGTPISSGRFCNACLGKMGQEMLQNNPVAPTKAEPPGGDKGMKLSKLKR